MPCVPPAPLRSALLVVAGLLMAISACHPQQAQPLPADIMVEMGAGGTPKRVQAAHLAADMEALGAYKSARQNENYGEMAYLFLAHRADLFKLADPRSDLELIDALGDGLGHHHAKFQQVVDGVPVWRKTLSVHFDPEDRLYRVDGDYRATPLGVETRPALSEADVRAKALEGIVGSGSGWKVAGSELIVYAPEAVAPRLAYRITVAKGLSGREDRIMDAATGQLLKRVTRIHN